MTYFYDKKYQSNYFSFSTLCGGRNDLSGYFNISNASDPNAYFFSKRASIAKDTSTSNTSDPSSLDGSKQAPVAKDTPTNITNTSSILDIDWNGLAYDLLFYGASDMCQESYVLGSGDIQQTVIVSRSCRCVLFDQVFNSNDNLKQFATVVRPLFYGKIYYHPSNVVYDNLIKQINQTFESLDELVKLFRQIQSTIQPIYQTALSLCNNSSNFPSICQQLNSFQTPLSLFTILTEFIACAEKNRFVAKNSESDMVSEGQNNSMTNTFLAGIEFLDEIPDGGSLPKHVRYKIRMALDYVDNTFRTQDR